MTTDKPDVHEDEHEVRGVIAWNYSSASEQRVKVRVYEERPIVWPVGCIPIKNVDVEVEDADASLTARAPRANPEG